MNKSTRLDILEAQIKTAKCIMFEALKEIKEGKLWPDEYPDFYAYLAGVHSYGKAWFSQLRSSYNAMQEIKMTMDMKNQYAIRTLRRYNEKVRQAVYDRAAKQAKLNGDQHVTAAHVIAVADTVGSILASGYADDGDGGMTAADAQIEQTHQELIERNRSYKHNGREWFTNSYTGGDPFPGVAVGETVEIRWCIVEVEVQ